MESFYDYIYSSTLLARAYIDHDAFRDRAILTVRNDTVAEINNSIVDRLTQSSTDFFSVDAVDANSADVNSAQEPPPAELLQSFNPPSLPPSKLRLKVGAPVILLRNLYPK